MRPDNPMDRVPSPPLPGHAEDVFPNKLVRVAVCAPEFRSPETRFAFLAFTASYNSFAETGPDARAESATMARTNRPRHCNGIGQLRPYGLRRSVDKKSSHNRRWFPRLSMEPGASARFSFQERLPLSAALRCTQLGYRNRVSFK